MLQRFGILTSLFLAAAFTTFAQTGTIKGFVYEKSNGEPVIYTSVFIEGTGIGVQTDLNGYFSIRSVPAGTYTIASTMIGYDTARVVVRIKENEVVSQMLYLSRRQHELQSVEISARKTEQQTQIKAGSITITPREMKMLPSTGGEPDIAQFLQVTPGVVFTGDQGGQLYIRGGAPSQTGILLDGVTIYNPFHSIGLYSVFETDAIRSVDIHTAGFNAEYGNRTSAILDVRTKDGNKNRLAGKVSASPIMGRVMLEGPITKPKSESGGSTTFLLSAKHSYLDKTSSSLYGGLGSPYNNGLPYSFTDLYGKVSFNASNGSKLNLFGFNFDDKAKMLMPETDIPSADFKWKATGGGATFVVSPGSSDALISGRIAYSKYLMDYNEINFRPRTSSIDGFESAIDFTYFLPGYSQLKYGVEVSGLHTSLNYLNSLGVETDLSRRNTMAAIYATYRKNFSERLIVEPSIRMMYYATLSKISPEPRLGLKYNVTRHIRLKGAAGMYSQNILSTKSDRDIVNFFNGFILSPDQTIYNTDGTPVANNLMTAYHLVGGIEADINRVEINIEPWFKHFTRHIELNRNKRVLGEPDFQAGDGKAYGVDLSARYSYQRLYLWGVVSYQHVTFTTIDDQGLEQTFSPPFDRRFNMNLVGSYAAGKKKEWEFSGRYNLGSPFPFTQTQGFYEHVNLLNNGIGTNYIQQNGALSLLYASTINGGRLSWYHRLDISVRRRFPISPNSNLDATFAVSNLYNRNNIFYVDRVANTRVYQLPVFPSVNLTWNF